MSPAALFDLYDGALRRIVDEHLPVENISVKDRPLTPWYDNDCRSAKRKVRMCERRYRRTRSEMDCMAWIRQMERKRNLLERKEESFWNRKITSNAGNSKKLWSVLNDLQRKDRAIPPSTSDISAETLSGILPRQGQGSAWRYFNSRCTDIHQADRRILHLVSALLQGGGSEIRHSVSAEVLFTGSPAHVHPTGVPRRVAPVHLHHVQRLLATWSAPWITEGSYRHANSQETRSWSGRCQELPSDLKLDIHLQGHRTDCCLAADGLPSDEQAPSLTTNQPTDRGIPRRLLFLRFSPISWTQLTRVRWRCSDC